MPLMLRSCQSSRRCTQKDHWMRGLSTWCYAKGMSHVCPTRQAYQLDKCTGAKFSQSRRKTICPLPVSASAERLMGTIGSNSLPCSIVCKHCCRPTLLPSKKLAIEDAPVKSETTLITECSRNLIACQHNLYFMLLKYQLTGSYVMLIQVKVSV